MSNSDAPAYGLQVHIEQQQPVSLDVDLNCNRGELLALVGPSGSGKSTVLRTIAGLNRVSHARIHCDGETWDDDARHRHVKTQRREVGLVFQDYALFPHKSALENVMLASPASGRKTRLHKAMSLLDRTNMTGLEQRMPDALSGGQRQRVALARALAREPRVLLLDEPFSAVDQQTRRKLYSELAALRQTLELPIILVTHDLTEVQLLADSLCLMHRGKSLVQGPVADVIKYPQSREVARLVGHQNLFNAIVESHDKNHTLYQLGQSPLIRGPQLAGADIGQCACLLILPSAIQLTADNTTAFTVKGTVQECIILGEELAIRLHLDDIPKSLRFRLTHQVATDHGVVKGSVLNVFVQMHGLHVMFN
ncbi:ABC transporter ATP-binding protein [Granulosicoccus sp.]|nr:ABC transporter ATP-binding protein [Granulosicoccus sp.]